MHSQVTDLNLEWLLHLTIGDTNTVLNAMMAEAFSEACDALEGAARLIQVELKNIQLS